MTIPTFETLAHTGSTNAVLLARLTAGEAMPAGHWLIADRQTAGRGRAGRVWNDGLGNFMGSTVVALGGCAAAAPSLALVTGVAVHQAVAASAPALEKLQLKWPNDLLLDGAKLAGILLELVGDHVVVGIGVNLVTAPAVTGRAVTSLAEHGAHVTRDMFAEVLAAQFAKAVARWHDGAWPALRQEWLARATPVGTLLAINDAHAGQIIGAFGGLDASGAALLRLADGALHTVAAGDVALVGQAG